MASSRAAARIASGERRSRGNVVRLYRANRHAGVDPPREALRAGGAGERFDRDYIVSLIPEP